MQPIRIKFWGVRGSIPTPGPRTIRYGGNTPCLEVQFPHKSRFILDAGSGIRELGKQLLQEPEPIKAYIFISHFHWDHIQGLPFFKPAFKKGNQFIIYGCDEPHLRLDEIISFQMDPTYFPLTIEDMEAVVEFRAVREEEFEVEGVKVKTKFLNHPGYALGYRFEYGNKTLIYISDNEPFFQTYQNPVVNPAEGENIEMIFEMYFEDKDKEIIEFVKDADVLIHDSQYLPEEYQKRVTWGHSPYNYTVDLAIKSGVKNLILFHHDPDHDDATIDRILQLSRQQIKERNARLNCTAAQECTLFEF